MSQITNDVSEQRSSFQIAIAEDPPQTNLQHIDPSEPSEPTEPVEPTEPSEPSPGEGGGDGGDTGPGDYGDPGEPDFPYIEPGPIITDPYPTWPPHDEWDNPAVVISDPEEGSSSIETATVTVVGVPSDPYA